MKKTFILGVGCQKGGTTWLYQQLIKSESVDLGYTKEYHVFDSIYTPYAFNNQQTLLEILKNHLNETSTAPVNLLRQLLFLEDESTYFHYFDELWSNNKTTEIVGDITPSYCCLRPEHLSSIKKRLEDLDFTVKVIFIMRDPVQRVWSACRHERRINKKLNKYSEDDLVLKLYKKPKLETRTRYDSTITNIEKVFDKDNIFYALYENLFNIYSVKRLSEFVGIESSLFDINDHYNLGSKKDYLSKETIREVALHYSPVYNFVGERFPINNFWDSSLNISSHE